MTSVYAHLDSPDWKDSGVGVRPHLGQAVPVDTGVVNSAFITVSLSENVFFAS